MSDEVLTIKEVAALLRLAEKTVYAMANAGEVPAFKIRGQWRIKRDELDRWIDAQPRGGASAGRSRSKRVSAPGRQQLGRKRGDPMLGRALVLAEKPARAAAKSPRRKVAAS